MAGRHCLDLTGQHFGMLTAVERCSERGKNNCVYWLCRCRCGGQTKASTGNLRRGNVRSCGCLRKSGHQRETPYPPNDDCALYDPERDECKGLEELLCAERGTCKFFKPR